MIPQKLDCCDMYDTKVMQSPGVHRPGLMSAWVVTPNFFKTISVPETTFLYFLIDFSPFLPHGSAPAVAAHLSNVTNVYM